MSNPSSPLKPAPLTFGRSDSNARASPFRRPESPSARSPSTVRAATPQGSPLKQSTPSLLSPSLLSPSNTQPALRPFSPSAPDDRSWITTRGSSVVVNTPDSPTKSPTPYRSNTNSLNAMGSNAAPSVAAASTARPTYTRTPTYSTVKPALNRTNSSDPLSSIPPQHLHTMRESFAVLDRKNTGLVAPTDLTHQLNELGIDSSSAALSHYFPPGTSSLNLSSYLHLLSSDLTRLTSSSELMEAFSAFDADDSGQIDVGELREALITTLPEAGEEQRRLSEREVDMVMEGFTGRRAFKRGAVANTAGLGTGARKEVFRYGDFVKGIWGAGGEGEKVEGM